jgi:hypothetical protein
MQNYKFFRFAILFGPFWFLLALFYIFFSRSAYPFELEFMEGGTLIHLLRLQEGLPLYVAPSLEYAPFIYPPFFYYVAFGISQLTGLDFFLPLRLTSILATTGCLFLIAGMVYKQTRSTYWAVLAAGVFIATFRAGGAWFDLARIDMLFVFLLLAAIAAGTSSEHWLAKVAAGLFLGLAFYTKQTAIAYAVIFVGILWLIQGWRTALITGLTFALFAIASFWVENRISGGWYQYYLFVLPANHALYSPLWLLMLVQAFNIIYPLSVSILLGLFGIIPTLKRLTGSAVLILSSAVGLAALSGASSLNVGAYANNYIPAFAGFALMFGLGASWLETRLLRSRQRAGLFLLYTACLLQFGLLYYNVNQQIPTAEDRQAGEQLVATIREIDGDVFTPYNLSLSLLAGKPAYAHLVTLLEIEGHFGDVRDSQWQTIEAEFEESLRQKRFSAIILNHEYDLWQNVGQAYTPTIIEYTSDKAFIPVTGTPTRPQSLWRPLP